LYVYNPEKEFPIEHRYMGKTKAETAAQVINGELIPEQIEHGGDRKTGPRLQDETLKDLDIKDIEQEQTSNLNESSPKKIVETPISQIEDPAFILDMIPGGCFFIARKIFKSEIWLKHPFYFKAWLWILGQANHADRKKDNRAYKRGELITTYDEIIKGVAYYYRHRLVFPSVQQIRDILKWLQSEEMIEVQPLCQTRHKIFGDTTDLGTDPKAEERTDPQRKEKTYLGIKIIVMNYDTYQTLDNYKKTEGKSREKTDPEAGEKTEGFSEIQHNNKNDTRKEDIYSQNSNEFRLSELLLNLILERRNTFKRPDLKKWAKHIDWMIRLDERDIIEIEKVIRWCQLDTFWQNNILSTKKLRKQFDTLALKMGDEEPKGEGDDSWDI